MARAAALAQADSSNKAQVSWERYLSCNQVELKAHFLEKVGPVAARALWSATSYACHTVSVLTGHIPCLWPAS